MKKKPKTTGPKFPAAEIESDSLARLSAKLAAQRAAKHLLSLVLNAKEIAVEETELSGDERFWVITLSYTGGPPFRMREYKIFKVSAATGEVLSMKIRKV